MSTVHCDPVSHESIARAAGLLREGHLVIVPTDTVYGIVADVRVNPAVEGIYRAKGKGAAAPLQLLFPGLRDVARYARLTPAAAALVDALGPGGWTIIVPAAPGWTSPALAGGTTVGFRMPNSPPLRALLEALDGPVAASSANRHGGPSPTMCGDAVAQVGEHVAIALDGGPAALALDSTVIDCSREEPVILREGAIDRETIGRILGLRHIRVVRSVRPGRETEEPS